MYVHPQAHALLISMLPDVANSNAPTEVTENLQIHRNILHIIPSFSTVGTTEGVSSSEGDTPPAQWNLLLLTVRTSTNGKNKKWCMACDIHMYVHTCIFCYRSITTTALLTELHTSHTSRTMHCITNLILCFVDFGLDLGHLSAAGINGGLDVQHAGLRGSVTDH